MGNVVKIRQHNSNLSRHQMDDLVVNRLDICIQQLGLIADYLHETSHQSLSKHLRLTSECAKTVSWIMRPK